MDSTLHTIIAAQYVQERMAGAQAARNATEARDADRRRRIRLPRARPTVQPRLHGWGRSAMPR